MLSHPAVGKGNPRTLQPRHRAMFILRLGKTIHDQDVTSGPAESKRELYPARDDAPGTPQNFLNSNLTMSLGQFCGPNKGSLSLCQRIRDPGPAHWFRFTRRWHIPSYHTKVIKKGAVLPHKPITPSQMALLVCGLTAAPCPYLYEHRQSCPGVTQAVS